MLYMFYSMLSKKLKKLKTKKLKSNFIENFTIKQPFTYPPSTLYTGQN